MRFNISRIALITSAVALTALCACTREPYVADNPASPRVLTLSLGAESATGTRVAFENDRIFKWQERDSVGAWMYSTTLNNVRGSYGVEGEYGPWMAPFHLASGAGTGSGVFTFDIQYPENHEEVGYVAIYPYSGASYYDGGSLVYNLPTYWSGLPDLNAVRIPMAANLDSAEKPLQFKHIGGAVKVTLTNVPAGARYFKLTADKNISGDFVVKVSDIGTAVLTGAGSEPMVELQLARALPNDVPVLDVYFPVPPGTYTFGLGIYGDGVVYAEKQGTTPNTIDRGTILRMPSVDLKVDLGEYDPNLAPEKKLSGITYQMNVFSFADSNGDGIGDFQGVIDHLDYLEALGVTAIWLSPIHPSQSYHGYDVTDYDSIAKRFGTKKVFMNLVREAHKRNMRIYLDYVINHTGNGHSWFLDVKQNGPASPYWNYYVISKDPMADCYAGNIDQIPAGWYDTGKWFDFTVSGTGEKYYYYSEFGTGMFADFNYYHGWNCSESPAFQAVVNAISTWLECGVDGMRLDAVKHIFAQETSYENIQFWKAFYNAVNSYYNTYAEYREDLTGKADPNIFMVGEVMAGEEVCLPFYEGLPSLFDFQYWYDLRGVLNSENAFANGEKSFCSGLCDRFYAHLGKRPDAIYSPKLSNHDEERTATTLGGYMPKIRLAATILLTSPGRPFIYQGEELGYWGTKVGGDEYVRTPILWTPDIGSAATKGIYDKYDANMLQAPIDVQSQEADSGSLLNLYRRFAYARNTNPAMADGNPEYDSKTGDNSSVLCWYMHANDGSGKCCLVMHNISRDTQTVERWNGENLSNILVASTKINVSGNKVTMPPYSSVVFAIN
ncbi:MAG: hypothetical protein J5737_03205 [Bacteroidales bacterium]|nr:hypothetical protein [Bacteroidales bacterium]